MSGDDNSVIGVFSYFITCPLKDEVVCTEIKSHYHILGSVYLKSLIIVSEASNTEYVILLVIDYIGVCEVFFFCEIIIKTRLLGIVLLDLIVVSADNSVRNTGSGKL